VEDLSPKSELRRRYLERIAQKSGRNLQGKNDFEDTKPNFHRRKFLDESIKPPRVYSLVRQK